MAALHRVVSWMRRQQGAGAASPRKPGTCARCSQMRRWQQLASSSSKVHQSPRFASMVSRLVLTFMQLMHTIAAPPADKPAREARATHEPEQA